MNYMWVIWFVLAIGFAVIELFNASFFIIWFSLGSLAALFTSLITQNLAIQGVVFLLISGIFLIFTRRIAKQFFHKSSTFKTNVDTMKGMKGIVIEEIDNTKSKGQIKVMGEIWSAYTETDSVIPIDTKVTVLDIKGVKLLVSPRSDIGS